MIALTNNPSPRIEAGERTHVARAPIDYALALTQHAAYRASLARAGARVELLEINRDAPDGVFVEDPAIVLDEAGVICSMGAASRRGETAAIAAELARWREKIIRIELPATIEGGDVARFGRMLLVGLSSRTNAAGARALGDAVRPFGYTVKIAELRGCLHLKSALTPLAADRALINPDWIAPASLDEIECLAVDSSEPTAANVLALNGRLIASAAYPRTIEKLEKLGLAVDAVDLSEFAKAEGCVTCMSLVFSA